MARVILHADLNNFFASVSCRGRPELMEVPVAVCGDPEKRHGIVLAKNNPAKKLGIKTGQAIWQAKELCPQLITVGVDSREVQRMSYTVRGIFSRYTSHVQPFGSDEAWLDISGPTTTIRDGVRIANHLRHAIREETGLTASIGVSDNRIFAKLGSDLKKPDAVSVIC
ncbi:MAG: DNA polymerase IV, partial [Clostridia bacterium]|nr:DNA polymerase IV [Clostridia bacterium]